MGIMDRMKDIVSANVNAVFDSKEDPVKMVDQYVRNLNEDLAKIRAKELVLQSEEKTALRRLDECKVEITKLENYASQAENAGKMDDKAVFDGEIEKAKEQLEVLEKRYQDACSNASEIHEMYEKLKVQVKELADKSEEMKAKARMVTSAESTRSAARSSADYTIQKTTDDIEKFEKLEDDINARLDLASSQLEDASDRVEQLKKQYDEANKAKELEKELEEMKD